MRWILRNGQKIIGYSHFHLLIFYTEFVDPNVTVVDFILSNRTWNVEKLHTFHIQVSSPLNHAFHVSNMIANKLTMTHHLPQNSV